MQREVIKIQTDVPVVVVLDQGPMGKQVEGNFGTQYQYTVNQDSGVMWVSPQAREAIVRSGAREGDQVQIVKQLHGKATSFDIQVLTSGVARAPASRPAAPQPIRTNGAKANGYANGNGAPAARALEQQAVLARHVTQRVEPALAQEPARPAPAPQPQALQVQETGLERLTKRGIACGRAAVDICAATEQYAASKGLSIKFADDSVRAIMITALIETMRRDAGGRS